MQSCSHAEYAVICGNCASNLALKTAIFYGQMSYPYYELFNCKDCTDYLGKYNVYALTVCNYHFSFKHLVKFDKSILVFVLCCCYKFKYVFHI